MRKEDEAAMINAVTVHHVELKDGTEVYVKAH